MQWNRRRNRDKVYSLDDTLIRLGASGSVVGSVMGVDVVRCVSFQSVERALFMLG